MRDFAIGGMPPSKSNSYEIVKKKSKKTGKWYYSLANSDEVKAYQKSFWAQLPPSVRNKNIQSNFGLMMDVFFKTKSNDLDNSFKIILDCLQQKNNRVIKNDNQCEYILARKFTGHNGKVKISILSVLFFELLFKMIDILKMDDLDQGFKEKKILEITKEMEELV